MNQPSLFDDAAVSRDTSAESADFEEISSISEVREIAREYFNLPECPPEAELALLRAKREQAARNSGAYRRGMVAKWAPYETAEGHISIHDPVSGEWHDVPYKDAPRWAKWEARRRAELYRSGHRHAYDLSSAQMHEIWMRETELRLPCDEKGSGRSALIGGFPLACSARCRTSNLRRCSPCALSSLPASLKAGSNPFTHPHDATAWCPAHRTEASFEAS